MAYDFNERQRALLQNREVNLNIRNKTERIPIWFCIEWAGHLDHNAVQAHLRELMNIISRDPALRHSVEMAIFSFHSAVTLVRPYSPIRIADPIILEHSQVSDEQLALKDALAQVIHNVRVEKRKYDGGGQRTKCPTLFLFSSGAGTDGLTELKNQLNQMQEKKELYVYPITNDPGNSFLSSIAYNGMMYDVGKRGNYDTLFQSISKSMKELSQSTGIAYASLLEKAEQW